MSESSKGIKIKDGHFTEEQRHKGEPRSDRRSPVGTMPFPYLCVMFGMSAFQKICVFKNTWAVGGCWEVTVSLWGLLAGGF